MPVPTDTFRNIKKLNLLFLAAAALLAGATLLFVVADYVKEWHHYQIAANRWQTAIIEESIEVFEQSQAVREVDQLEQQIAELRESMPTDRIDELQRQLDAEIAKRETLKLPLATVKGLVGPLEQQLERARVADDADAVKEKSRELSDVLAKFNRMDGEMTGIKRRINELTNQLTEVKSAADDIASQITSLTRKRDSDAEKLAALQPTGSRWIVEQVRNAPLLDWLNPSLKPHQDVVPEVRFDVNFMTVETIDRCRTCHVNIDKPEFEMPAQLAFVERQVATMKGQDITSVDAPVVMLDFWLQAARNVASPAQLAKLDARTLKTLNELRDEVDLDEIEDATYLFEELNRLVDQEPGNEDVTRSRWYAQAANYRADLQKLIKQNLGDEGYNQLVSLYRTSLIAQFNELRAERGYKPLDPSPVLLAHPKLDMFVGVESLHPLKTMGCTVCHEGSGSETIFEHTAHTPRDIWVDAATGTPLPEKLVDETGTKVRMKAVVRNSRKLASQASADQHLTPVKAGILTPLLATSSVSEDHVHDAHTTDHGSHDDPVVHFDLNLNNPDNPAPFAPEPVDHAEAAAYQNPADAAGQLRLAVKQANYWHKKFGWEVVHYMHWEKPMNRLDYVESACTKCHTEVYDLKEEAPVIFEGRTLFAQLGCANCHAVTDLEDDLDIKKVGPNLQFVKDKLSPEMTGSWIWAPRAFRPMANMPHYFMLENNSQPVDIERTRVEVAAITHYLRNAEVNQAWYAEQNKPVPSYQPEAVPEGLTGNAETGGELFKSVGCLACHVNMNETGKQWITRDLMARKQLDEDEAAAEYDAMSYNQQHWYAMEHLDDELVRVGPELSGVGTKLLAGRTETEAYAWLYDWLRNPTHYSDYTIMPSFRLTEQEAMDMAAYLLGQKRPDDYEVVDFQNLGDKGTVMLDELVASLKAGQITTLPMARQEVAEMKTDDKLMFLGRKVISHYGCNGCHAINGFESAASACTTLDGWGLKDPHKLDFGYFDHAFDKQREEPVALTRVAHEGLTADATKITADSDRIQTIDRIGWETMELTNRPWLYNKLHNPRVYDRMRTTLDGEIGEDGQIDIGRPYDKLKMPKFFMTDKQAKALVTYVTSVRKPLVSDTLRAQTYAGDRMARVKGQQLATLYNCYGCHNIDNNEVQIQQYFGVHNKDGSYNENALNWAPPRLVGQGSKTQPDWLAHFLQNVQPIRPWLKVRMPSFPLHNEDATVIADYFAASSNLMGDALNQWLTPVEKYRGENPDAPWWRSGGLTDEALHLRTFAAKADLMPASKLDPRYTPDQDELASNWATALKKLSALANTYPTDYPFVERSEPVDASRLLRGEKLFVEMGCMAGECHRLGNLQLLAEKDMLVKPAPVLDDEEWEDEEEDEDSGKAKPVIEVAPSTPPGGAPNLALTQQRLQREWVSQWLQHAHAIQPGTRMQEFWPNNDSQFGMYPEDMRKPKEAMYGYTAEAQKDLLLDFLYTVGGEKITYSPEGERLEGAPAADIKLEALAPPPDAKTTDGKGEAMAEGEGGEGTETETTEKTPEAPPTVVATTSSIELHDGEQAWSGSGKGRIVGVVKFDGKAPRRRPIRMDADRFCAAAHEDRPLDPTLVVNDDGSIQNVFIGAQGASGEVPPNMVVMDQIGCEYTPHIAAAMVGQTVEIRNSDNTLHNVKTQYFNKGMPVRGMKFTHVFDKPETVQFKCDVHPWMGGQLHVVENPYFAVSDVEGRFEITGLPPGKYTFETRHEDRKVKSVTFDVEVKADMSTRMDVTVSR